MLFTLVFTSIWSGSLRHAWYRFKHEESCCNSYVVVEPVAVVSSLNKTSVLNLKLLLNPRHRDNVVNAVQKVGICRPFTASRRPQQGSQSHEKTLGLPGKALETGDFPSVEHAYQCGHGLNKERGIGQTLEQDGLARSKGERWSVDIVSPSVKVVSLEVISDKLVQHRVVLIVERNVRTT